ncbi:MAG TPA: rhomboid family intramembrane serine protease [Flavobacteriaceae bacterium]|nr:rhomboid family intramembrane serine protease [Flavobacteriaceae bacterium]
MGRITETVKILLIVNIIFYIGANFMIPNAYELFSLYFFENPNFQFWQPVTHMFMHGQLQYGGITHILFNMYALWAFGSPLEQMWGRNKFLFFYLSAGIGAAMIHSLVNYYHFQAGYDALIQAGLSTAEIQNILTTGQYRTDLLNTISKETLQSFFEAYNVPAVGASGAIYGILVAFGMMFPNVELFLIFVPIPIKAKVFIPILILIDLFSGLTGFSLFGGGIAHWAHIGGALFGFIMMWYWKKNSFNQNRWY